MEQELFNMLLLNNEESVFNFLKNYSSSEELRKKMLDTLAKNDVNLINSFNTDNDTNISSNAANTVKALFKGLGISIENENGELNVSLDNENVSDSDN